MRLLHNKFSVIWLFGLIAAGLVWSLAFIGYGGFSNFNTQVFDRYQQIKPREWANSDILVLDIDESSLRKMGQWPWPRTIIAELTDKLGEMGAAAIVFDIVFSEPDRTSPLIVLDSLKQAGVEYSLPNDHNLLDNDRLLAEAFSRNRVVTGMILTENGTKLPPVPKVGTGFGGTPPAAH